MATSIYAGVVATTDVEEATRDVEIAIMVGGFPRKAGMERKDVMSKNVSIYKSQASALEKNAKAGVKVNTSSFLLCAASRDELRILWHGDYLGCRSSADVHDPVV